MKAFYFPIVLSYCLQHNEEGVTHERMVNVVDVSVDRTFDTVSCMPPARYLDSFPAIVFGIVKCHLSSDKTYLEKLCPVTSVLSVFTLSRDRSTPSDWCWEISQRFSLIEQPYTGNNSLSIFYFLCKKSVGKVKFNHRSSYAMFCIY